MLSIAMNCFWNILFRKIAFDIFCSGKLFFVLVLWVLKYFENFLMKNICTKCSWLNLRFTDWYLHCSIALSVSLDFCDKRGTVWYSVTNPWVDWLIDQLFAWTSWLIAIAISFQFCSYLKLNFENSSPIEVNMNWLWLLCSITEFVSGLIDIHLGTWSSQNSLELDSDFFLNSWILFVYDKNLVEI